jgi:chloride channel protein, CIC family
VKKYLLKYTIFVFWIKEKLTAKQFLIFSAIMVGLSAGLAAVLLKMLIHYIRIGITYNYKIPFQNYLYLIFPLMGIVLTVYYVKRFAKGKSSKGTSVILYSIAKKQSYLPKEQMYNPIITSGITVGLGGSAGVESPIVSSGSAIGSNYAQTYRIDYKDRTLLLACGAAAGIAAAFNAPIAGVLFALEVLLVDASISAFIPLMIAAAAGVLCANVLLEKEILLSFRLTESFKYYNILFYVLLGLFCGLVSVYYSRMFLRVEHAFRRNKMVFSKAISGGIMLALLILMFPTLFGEGYQSIKSLNADNSHEILHRSVFEDAISNEWLMVGFVGIVMLVKVFAAAITINAGGFGGNFAPSLFVGGYLGYVFSKMVNLTGFTNLPIGNFTMVGMAGILSGIFHAPLTAIFLIAEITGGYELMIPLMVVSAFSYTVSRYFEPYSMDSRKLATIGHVFTQDRDKNILSVMKTASLMETDFVPLYTDMKLGEVVKIITESRKVVFPVLDKNGRFSGIIVIDNITDIMFNQEFYDKYTAGEIMEKCDDSVHPDDDMIVVMKRFDRLNAWVLPVVDIDKFKGFIYKTAVFSEYRDKIKEMSGE